jgi:mannose-6-phosphate isomerase-like protein (cupin superfamily)
MKDWVVSLAAAKAAPPSPGRISSLHMEHGSMTLRFYTPKGVDTQTPHDQDEIYIVASGHGHVVSGPSEAKLEKNVHRFVDFTADFGTWVVFWGPKGGEA